MVVTKQRSVLSLPDRYACANEPIHGIGKAQSYGFLIAVSESDLTVRFISENVRFALGAAACDLLLEPLSILIGEAAAAVFAQAAPAGFDHLNPLRFNFGRAARLMECVAHRQNGMIILELEPVDGVHTLSPVNISLHVRRPIARMEREMSVEGLTVTAAAEFQRASGFDRVIIYRFDPDWSGHVVAEAPGGPWPSYLGHHFPASDIPEQARRLFLLNPLRAIVDVISPPVAILATDDEQRLDMSFAHLRTPSPVHAEYLRNAGVRATLTASIVVRGELWGMVTAHHRVPHRLDFTTRELCGLLAQQLAERIGALRDTALLEARLTSRDRIEAYMLSIEQSFRDSESDAFDVLPLMNLLEADGLWAHIDGVDMVNGIVVDRALLSRTIADLRANAVRGVSSSSCLSDIDSDAESFAGDASGALFIGIEESATDYIVLLRKELVQTIVWAGDPEKATTKDETGTLHPRPSFAPWSQSVRGRCRPWTDLELETARVLRERLMQMREAQRRHEAEKRVRYLAQFDVLTGLPNRSSIQELLEHHLERAIAVDAGLVVLFVDLDRFKHYNDSLGHGAGDRILQVVAARMLQCIRDDDAIGRIGGDEFIAVLPGVRTQQQALLAADRLLAAIEKPFRLEGTDVHITASIGMSSYPRDGTSSEALLRNSDIAMYRAKESGGNALEIFDAS